MIQSRNKGRSGEQEVARLIREYLHIPCHRNWQAQAAEGGADIEVNGWAIEVKRAKRYSPRWWEQAASQISEAFPNPALCYRLDGQGRGLPLIEKWQVEIYAGVLVPGVGNYRITMPLIVFLEYIR